MAGRKSVRVAAPIIFAALAVGLALASRARATVYAGNGATGFGGPVGTGHLAVTDDGAGNVTFAFTPGAGHPSVDGNSLVVYLSTGAPGLSDTSALTDIGDNGRRAITGYNTYGEGIDPTRSLLAFPTGFQATYALSMEGGFVGLFQLPPVGGDGGLSFVAGAGQSGNPLSVTFPLSSIGLTQGQSFGLLGSLIDGAAAYRSNETIGATDPDIGTGGNPGFNNLINFSTFFTYASTGANAPTQWALAAGGSWTTAANWTNGVPNAAGAAANFASNPGLTTNGTITLDGAKTVGTLSFNNATASYAIAPGSGGTLTIDNAGGASGSTPGITVTAGSHSITAPIQLANGMTVNSVAGTQLTASGGIGGNGDLAVGGAGTFVLGGTNTYSGNTVINAGATLNAKGSMPATTLTANGTVTFGAATSAGIATRSFAAINISGTATVRVAAPSASTNRTVLVTSGLTFGGAAASPQGLLDLTANDLIVRGGTVANIQTQLKQGLAGLAGITSTSAAASTSQKTAIGFAAMTAAGTFDGQAVAAGDVVLKYTFVGDTNLDSSVNFTDLLALAKGYNGTSATWASGDFNYDGNTNFADLLGLAKNYGATLSASDVAQLQSVAGESFAASFGLAQSLVPEPGSVALLSVAAIGIGRRGRQR